MKVLEIMVSISLVKDFAVIGKCPNIQGCYRDGRLATIMEIWHTFTISLMLAEHSHVVYYYMRCLWIGDHHQRQKGGDMMQHLHKCYVTNSANHKC